MQTIKTTVDKIINIPAKPETPYPQIVSWVFSITMLFSFIYVCQITGM